MYRLVDYFKMKDSFIVFGDFTSDDKKFSFHAEVDKEMFEMTDCRISTRLGYKRQEVEDHFDDIKAFIKRQRLILLLS
jgi:hypothetical protein